jgi:hypothetical protein
MISAEQARKDLMTNKKADYEKYQSDEVNKREAEKKEIARALKEDVPKIIKDIEAQIYKAVAERKSDIKYQESASPAVSAAFDAVKTYLQAHGYTVTKDFYSGTCDMSDECRGIPYEKYTLYITW